MRGIEFYTTHFLICGNIDRKEKRSANRHLQQKYIERKIGTKSSKFVMAVTLYTFIVYMTDNTELYLMNQFFYILTLLLFMNRELKGEYIK